MQHNITGYTYWFHLEPDYRQLVKASVSRGSVASRARAAPDPQAPAGRDAEPVRRRAHHLPAHARPAGRPGGVLRRPGGNAGGGRAVREQLGLDRTLPVQFGIYLKDLARGDLGQALSTGQPVREDLLTRLPASLELVLASLLFAVVIAIPLGIAAARRPNSWIDHACRLVTTAGVSLPTFFTGPAAGLRLLLPARAGRRRRSGGSIPTSRRRRPSPASTPSTACWRATSSCSWPAPSSWCCRC